jgi:hypothetical protein
LPEAAPGKGFRAASAAIIHDPLRKIMMSCQEMKAVLHVRGISTEYDPGNWYGFVAFCNSPFFNHILMKKLLSLMALLVCISIGANAQDEHHAMHHRAMHHRAMHHHRSMHHRSMRHDNGDHRGDNADMNHGNGEHK